MSREIKINKYEGNTCYSVSVIDSYGKEHHLGYLDNSGKYNHSIKPISIAQLNISLPLLKI